MEATTKPVPVPNPFGECVICGQPITIRDTEGGNDHCRNGHVYATDHATHDFGPMTAQQIEARLKAEEKVTKPITPTE